LIHQIERVGTGIGILMIEVRILQHQIIRTFGHDRAARGRDMNVPAQVVQREQAPLTARGVVHQLHLFVNMGSSGEFIGAP
jgi:hypothetical protein